MTDRTPNRTLEQRLTALEEANKIRTARAELKLRIKREGIAPLVAALKLDTEALRLRPHDLDTMRVAELLLAAPKLGRVKVNRRLALLRISPSKTLGGLSDRQRGELLDSLVPPPAPPAPFYRARAQEGSTTR